LRELSTHQATPAYHGAFSAGCFPFTGHDADVRPDHRTATFHLTILPAGSATYGRVEELGRALVDRAPADEVS
jgi:hypothetical protein